MRGPSNHREQTDLSEIESLEAMLLMSASSCSPDAGTDDHDLLIASAPGQILNGRGGNDLLFGTAGDNTLNGGSGQDHLFVQRGENLVDGGAGNDTVYFWGVNRADANVVRMGDGSIRVETPASAALVRNVEKFVFRDGTFLVQELFPAEQEYRTFDGTNNNLQNAELGSTDEHLIRLSTAEYADGIASPSGEERPNPRTISNEIVAQQPVPKNARQLTDMTWVWGQFLDHDLSLTTTAKPAEPFPIRIPSGDHLYDPGNTGEMEFVFNRSVFDPETGNAPGNPRQQINQVTSFMDGSMVYGSDDDRAAALRSFSDGGMLVTEDDLLIFNTVGQPNENGTLPETALFLGGDVRTNENVALAAMHTLWVREHNRIAAEILLSDASLTDEQVFQQARELVIAQIQAITYNEFLPALMRESPLPEYAGYQADVNPTVATEFSAAAFRFGHTMLSPELLRLNNDRTVIEAGNLPLKDAFFAPQEIIDHGIDSVLLGATQQAANEIDVMIIDDVRNFLFGGPGSGGFDLASLNIQRGRDHGLADYNTNRTQIGLPAVTQFSDITSDPHLQSRLQTVYGTVDNIDLWVAGLAEDHVAGGSMGETFRAIITDQFRRLRDGDRFWYELILDESQLQLVRSTTLADVIERNTDVQDLQENAFFLT